MSLDYETLKLIWWLLIGLLLIGFALTDGFDLGVGALLPFVAKDDEERRVVINTIGPTWEGNQVWFVTAGGALFAAWPLVYATVFSGFYAAMLVVLFALFLRPVGFDYRSKIDNPRWRAFWDWGLFVGGFFPALVFGVAFGNLLQGVPFHFDADLRSFYSGDFFDLLNPFGLLVGAISLLMVVMHGAIFLQLRTEGNIQDRSKRVVMFSALFLVIALVVGGVWIATEINGYRIISMPPLDADPNPLAKTVDQAPGLWMLNYADFSWLWMLTTTIFVAIGLTSFMAFLDRPGLGFITSCLALASIILNAGFTMFPFIAPSSTAPHSSLTLWDACSSYTTLKTMFWVSIFFLPLVAGYTSWVYRILRGKVTAKHIRDNKHTAY